MTGASSSRPWVGRIGLVAAAIAVFVVLSGWLESAGPGPGDKAPALQVPAVDGGVVSLNDYRGKLVVVDFWSVSCPPCRMQLPVLERIQREFSRGGVQVLGVEVGGTPLEDLAALARRHRPVYPWASDVKGVWATAYRVRSLPTLFVIDPDGRIAHSHVGYWDYAALRQTLVSLLEGAR